MKKQSSRFSLDELHALHRERAGAIRGRLADFGKISPGEYFYELAYCLLTPQSSAVNAGRAIRLLQEHDFHRTSIDPEPLLHQENFYIRFHKTKARHLVAFRAQFPVIARQLASGEPAHNLREWLVQHVKGLGWKEASHFLRNIGYRDLAILDRHILRNLVRYRIIRTLPKSLTAQRYKQIEKKFLTFALRTGIPMDELDLLFWSLETGEILK